MSDGTARPDGRVPSSREGERVLDLIALQARLRAPDGCPWDREQTHRTLARHLLEETHELLEAIDADDDDAIRDELGDLLLQVTFHAEIAAEDGRWDIDDVAAGLVRKLIRRHPHVFGDLEVAGADEVLVNWERLKAEETGGRPGVEQDIPASLPALARAAKVQRRAAGWGFAWRSRDQISAKLQEEIGELEAAAESALRRATSKLAERADRTLALAEERGLDLATMPDEERERLYREARGSTG